ncbi:MAG: IclR family transcriptional regulator [Zoogloeaceae bacterium]|jgi:DNA-binding IclR family transcriptional regulator|nr:IclR family transcriptional regulator [Zoogloeaceae bacterium]
MTDYTNDAQQRLIRLILLMFGDVVQGFPPSVLSREIGCAPAVTTRDLANLSEAGIAAKDEATGLWRLTPRLPQQAIKVWTAIDHAEQQLQEAKQRFRKTL